MTSIAYDASRVALLQPAVQPTFFAPGAAQRLSLDAVCAECARLAYLRFETDAADHQRLLDALALLDATAVQTFAHAETDSQAFAATLPALGTLVVFRGTEPDKGTDLGTDLRADTQPWEKGGAVHAGFANAFASLRGDVETWLAAQGGASPVVTGHSLGAALATLAASAWSVSRLVTIGSPRVGDGEFTQTIQAPVARYVGCCDIVTRVPPETDWYRHAGERRYIDRNGVVLDAATDEVVDADRTAARAEYLRHYAWKSGNNLLRELADHAPVNYVRALVG